MGPLLQSFIELFRSRRKEQSVNTKEKNKLFIVAAKDYKEVSNLEASGYRPDKELTLVDIYTLLEDYYTKSEITPIINNDILAVAASDELTPLAAGPAVTTFRMAAPIVEILDVRASLTTAQASGNILTVDVNANGASIFTTPITIDNTEKTSVTAVTPPVLTTTSLPDDAEITIDIDQIGDGTATGLKVYFVVKI